MIFFDVNLVNVTSISSIIIFSKIDELLTLLTFKKEIFPVIEKIFPSFLGIFPKKVVTLQSKAWICLV